MNKLLESEWTECTEILDSATECHLVMEVVSSAFKYKEENPEASLLDCLTEGACEWDI